MHHHVRILAIALASCCTASFQAAAAKQPLADCVNLSADHQAVRAGNQYLAIKDGEHFYRLGFSGGNCSPLATSTQVKIVTDGTANRLCPQKSQVQLYRDSCAVTKVDEIESDDFARYKRMGR